MMSIMTINSGSVLDRLRKVTASISLLCGFVPMWTATPAINASFVPYPDPASSYVSTYTSQSFAAPPGMYQWSAMSPTSPGQIEESVRRAREELDVTSRILTAFRNDLVPEFVAYLNELDKAFGAFEHRVDIEQLRALASRLALARSNFAVEASTVALWFRLSEAMDPMHVGPRRVPERFVVAYEPEPEPDLSWSESDARVDRTLRELFEGDADPAAS